MDNNIETKSVVDVILELFNDPKYKAECEELIKSQAEAGGRLMAHLLDSGVTRSDIINQITVSTECELKKTYDESANIDEARLALISRAYFAAKYLQANKVAISNIEDKAFANSVLKITELDDRALVMGLHDLMLDNVTTIRFFTALSIAVYYFKAKLQTKNN